MTKKPQRDPMHNLAEGIGILGDAMGGRSSAEAIKRTEASNAKAAGEHRLPFEGHKALTGLGFEFGERVDDIYVEVKKWPEGFVKKYHEDPRGFWIEDPSGKKVAEGFVKDVFYDRNAHVYLSRQ